MSMQFRFDLGAACLNFVATVGGRKGESPVERMPTAQRAMQWVRESGLLDVGDQLATFTATDLHHLRNLRELLHRVMHDYVEGHKLRSEDIQILNTLARDVLPVSVALTCGGAERAWMLISDRRLTARNVVALIAIDAIRLIGGDQRRLLKQCEGSTCDGVYLDNTRAFNRRWCSSASCGNCARVAKHRQRGESERLGQ